MSNFCLMLAAAIFMGRRNKRKTQPKSEPKSHAVRSREAPLPEVVKVLTLGERKQLLPKNVETAVLDFCSSEELGRLFFVSRSGSAVWSRI